MAIYQENTENVTRVLQPTGNGVIDIINDYSWTLSPQSARDTVPYVTLTEYQQTTAQLLASIAYYYKQGTEVFQQGAAQLLSRIFEGYGDVHPLIRMMEINKASLQIFCFIS